MSEKVSWLLVENETLKVVYGSTLKCVKIKDAATLDYNIDFFSKLFSNGKVVSVEKANFVSYEEFQDFLLKNVAPEEKAPPPPPPPPQPVPPSIGGIKMAPPPVQQQAPRSQIPVPARPDSKVRTVPNVSKKDLTWLKSNAATTIILDDLPTNRLIQGIPGAYESLSIPPDRCINLLSLNPASVRASQTLRRYLQAGIIELTTAEEASRMASEADAKKEAEDQQMMDHYSPLLPEGVSAADFADSISNGQMPGDDTEIIEITDDAPISARSSGGASYDQVQNQQINQLAQAFTQPVPTQQQFTPQFNAAFMGAPVAGLHEDMSNMKDFGLEDLISIAEQPIPPEQRFVAPVPARPQRAKAPVTSFTGKSIVRKDG